MYITVFFLGHRCCRCCCCCCCCCIMLLLVSSVSGHNATLLLRCESMVLAVHSSSSRYWTVISVREWLVSSCSTSFTITVTSMISVKTMLWCDQLLEYWGDLGKASGSLLRLSHTGVALVTREDWHPGTDSTHQQTTPSTELWRGVWWSTANIVSNHLTLPPTHSYHHIWCLICLTKFLCVRTVNE